MPINKVIQSGLVARYSCTTGGKILVDKLNSHNGSFLGSTIQSTQTGLSCVIAGADYVNCGTKSGLQFTTAFTISMWFKRASGIVGPHLGKYAGGGTNKNYLLQIWSDNRAYLVIPQSGSDFYGYTGTNTNTNWQHIAAVYKGGGATNADKAKIYINGVEQSLTFNASIPATCNVSTTNFEINRYNSSTLSTAQYRDILLYNRALTQVEIQQNYISTKRN